jgi:starch synthase
MRIWIPELGCKSGSYVYTQRLAKVLKLLGHEVEITPLSNKHQGFPYFLKLQKPLIKPDVVIADTISGAMFKGIGKSLIIVEHHCVFDSAYAPYRSPIQVAVHELLWRRYEKSSLKAADAVVCVSEYTASSVQNVFGILPVHVIPNAIETDYFCPDVKPSDDSEMDKKQFGLLYVGNLTKRKGYDLLPGIMSKLGPGFELRYTSGLRTTDTLSKISNAASLGRLSDEELLKEYRRADVLLFPTRFEGFGYAAAEAMACGTPVISSRCSSIPEVVIDGETGLLCAVDDVECFVRSIKRLAEDHELRAKMNHQAREVAVEQFSMERWSTAWSNMLHDLI